MKCFKTKKQDGFTLVELLVVITILMVLVGIVTVSLNSGSTKASASSINYLEKGRQLAQAVESYYVEHDNWPANSTGLVPQYLKSVPSGWTDTKGDCKVGGTSNYPCQAEVNDDPDKNDDYTVQAVITKKICQKLVTRSDYGKIYAVYKGTTTSTDRIAKDTASDCADDATDGTGQNYLVYMIRPGS